MWDVKEPTHYSKRVGREVSRCCGCPLFCSFWVGALHRDNLMHLSPLDRKVQEKWLWTMITMKGCAFFQNVGTFLLKISVHSSFLDGILCSTATKQYNLPACFSRWVSTPTRPVLRPPTTMQRFPVSNLMKSMAFPVLISSTTVSWTEINGSG